MPPPTPIILILVGVAVLTPTTTHAHPELTPDTHSSHAHINEDGSYAFAYAVDAPDYRNFHDREEARLGKETRGRFRVALPDNRLQTVTYTADGSGFSASVTYDVHPDFESLRKAVGPIGAAPEIGQSVLDGIRRGENWKHHRKVEKNDAKTQAVHNSVSQTSSYQASAAISHQRPRTPSPRPNPTRVRPSPNHQTSSRRPFSRRTNIGPSPPRPPVTAALHAPNPTISKPRPTSLTRRPRPNTRRPTPQSHPTSAVSTRPNEAILFPVVDQDSTDILNRLILAIRRKVEEEGLTGEEEMEEHEEEGKKEKKYTIGDKASVLDRLAGIVHSVHLASLHTHG